MQSAYYPVEAKPAWRMNLMVNTHSEGLWNKTQAKGFCNPAGWCQDQIMLRRCGGTSRLGAPLSWGGGWGGGHTGALIVVNMQCICWEDSRLWWLMLTIYACGAQLAFYSQRVQEAPGGWLSKDPGVLLFCSISKGCCSWIRIVYEAHSVQLALLCCVPFQLGSRNFMVPGHKFQLEHPLKQPLKLNFWLGKSEEPL